MSAPTSPRHPHSFLRPGVLLALALALLAAAPAATAQDGCTREDPCPWTIDVDEDGFDFPGGQEGWNWTQGDWFEVSILNLDDQSHTVTVEGYGLSWTADAVDETTSEPFRLDRAGTFTVRDEPSGDTATLQVFEGDVVDIEEDAAAGGDEGDDRGRAIPTSGLVGISAVLVALLFVRRRP